MKEEKEEGVKMEGKQEGDATGKEECELGNLLSNVSDQKEKKSKVRHKNARKDCTGAGRVREKQKKDCEVSTERNIVEVK